MGDEFKAGEVYNIGGEEFRSVREMSDLILKFYGKDDSIVTDLPEDRHNVQNKRPDISRAKEAFGHDPKTTLEEGIPRTLEWMQQVHGDGPV